jgi:hypothetical protein
MTGFDHTVAEALGLKFVDVNMKDPDSYQPYRDLLLRHYPGKRELSLPTYLLTRRQDGEVSVQADLVGAMEEDVFRSRLKALLPEDLHAVDQPEEQQPDG